MNMSDEGTGGELVYKDAIFSHRISSLRPRNSWNLGGQTTPLQEPSPGRSRRWHGGLRIPASIDTLAMLSTVKGRNTRYRRIYLGRFGFPAQEAVSHELIREREKAFIDERLNVGQTMRIFAFLVMNAWRLSIVSFRSSMENGTCIMISSLRC